MNAQPTPDAFITPSAVRCKPGFSKGEQHIESPSLGGRWLSYSCLSTASCHDPAARQHHWLRWLQTITLTAATATTAAATEAAAVR
jgi:hypothetical protein